uniref:Predicted gene 11037 n=1 Tax=Peromyscus maniculatus bairdii TaxID=230844 RepID=A0A8C8TZ12_PERMB
FLKTGHMYPRLPFLMICSTS